jgi:hypothetical protein
VCLIRAVPVQLDPLFSHPLSLPHFSVVVWWNNVSRGPSWGHSYGSLTTYLIRWCGRNWLWGIRISKFVVGNKNIRGVYYSLVSWSFSRALSLALHWHRLGRNCFNTKKKVKKNGAPLESAPSGSGLGPRTSSQLSQRRGKTRPRHSQKNA